MFGTPPKIDLTSSSLVSVNMVAELKTEEELQAALESIQVFSENNEAIHGVEKEDMEDQIINKQTKMRQLSINKSRKESLNNLKIQASKMTEMFEKRFQGNIGESVKVKIPDVDRAQNYLRCVLGVIISSSI